MDVNEHERLSNITFRDKSNKGTACSEKGYGCKGNMRDYPTLHLDTN